MKTKPFVPKNTKRFANHITVENFDILLDQDDTVGQFIFERLTQLFDMSLDPYDRSDNTYDFDYKDDLDEGGSMAIQLIDQEDGMYLVEYIN